jgi:ABC-type molybdate transport system permease subunit
MSLLSEYTTMIEKKDAHTDFIAKLYSLNESITIAMISAPVLYTSFLISNCIQMEDNPSQFIFDYLFTLLLVFTPVVLLERIC